MMIALFSTIIILQLLGWIVVLKDMLYNQNRLNAVNIIGMILLPFLWPLIYLTLNWETLGIRNKNGRLGSLLPVKQERPMNDLDKFPPTNSRGPLKIQHKYQHLKATELRYFHAKKQGSTRKKNSA